ncbi:MAG TPA: hypothetical protein VI893_05605 [Thermoplasmata archaeon]|nr:hypothetical protein [Thermoplasmata archaeon]
MTGEPVAVACQIGFSFLPFIVIVVIVAAVVTTAVLYLHLRRARPILAPFGWSAQQWDGNLGAYYRWEPSTGALEPYRGRIQP